jgi:hypothetical protein
MPKNVNRGGAFGAIEADRDVNEAWIMGPTTGSRDASLKILWDFVTDTLFTRRIDFGEFRPA